jgi:archaellum component FlaC
MTARSKIVGLTRQIDPQSADDVDHLSEEVAGEADAPLLTAEDRYEAYVEEHLVEDDQASETRWTSYAIPALIITGALAWTAFFGWTYYPEVRPGLTGERAVTLLSMWTSPALLLAVMWLLAMRHSSAEASRFGNVARLLRTESEALEARMRTVNEEISLAREFLAQNARELETVGKRSSENLTNAASLLTSALADSDEKAKTLEAVSNAANSNLDQLRKHLPVVTSAAKDVTNQIGSAGNNAQLQIKSLIAGLERVGETGKLTREYLDAMEARAGEVSEKLGEITRESATTLERAGSGAERRAAEAAKLIENAANSMTSHVAIASGEVDALVTDSRAQIENHLNLLRTALAGLTEQSAAEQNRISSIIAEIEAHITSSAERIAEIDKAATDQTAKLAFAVSALGESTRAVGTDLGNNRETTDQLIERSDKLLSALGAVNSEVSDIIPASMERMYQRLSDVMEQLSSASSQVDTLDAMSSGLLTKTASLEQAIIIQKDSVEKLMAESDQHFAARHEQADALAAALNHTRSLVDEMTEDANGKLVSSLLRVRETTKQAAESSRRILDEELATIADRLTEQNKSTLAEAIDSQISAMNGAIQQAVDRNLELSETSTAKLASQLAQLDELADNLEKRIADSRNEFEGIDDDSFARRMVLLTESLNSTAIDVAKILSNDVTDTAWAAYLKGDRGVFTRRAVRLLDAGEARAIATHYGDDAEFREHVNRYIHDFESMMRVLLSTRDGNAIGVTLLSSDVGKLYVALAQAIERLRN